MSLSCESRQVREATLLMFMMKTKNELKIRMRRRTRKKRRLINLIRSDVMQILVFFSFVLAIPFVCVGAQARQQEEQASLKISTVTANATTVAHPKQPRQQHIYRIRAAQLNGNLAPPIRVLSAQPSPVQLQPQQQLSTFGARSTTSSSSAAAAAAANTRANLQLQPQNDCAKTNTATAAADEQQEASGSSISATSQVLRFLNNNNNNRSSSASVASVQRLGEIEENPARSSIILPANKSRESIEPTTTASSILTLIDEFDSKIITNKTRGE